ncbi:hypothetical protein GIB67_016398 [Kingdonia uniflora]|uniref:Replication factor A C-terminal domain-containing protein n=1 Tax=Kingdonia uniflora TaxID=39325 RepID=A0A7J7MGZ2_9MAGN|nr:hypothetical protein GIB67_016398 [Kingdonia uniflora]
MSAAATAVAVNKMFGGVLLESELVLAGLESEAKVSGTDDNGQSGSLGKALSSDKIVESKLTPLTFGIGVIKNAMIGAGAFGCMISGVDPTTIAVTDSELRGEKIGEKMVEVFWKEGNLKATSTDNVFVNVVVSIKYRALSNSATDAFYKLSNTRLQIQAYVFDGIRTSVPKLILDDVFEQKNKISKAVEDELEKAMSAYGKNLGDRTMKLLSGSCYLPQPNKEDTRGEDAHFICDDEQTFGLADSVEGRIIKISETVNQQLKRGFETLKKYVTIQNERGNNLRITLWGSVAAELGRELDQLNGQNTLLVITSLSTNLWNDMVNISSTFSTRIYINLDIPEATIFFNSIQANIELTPTKQGKYFNQNMLDSQTTITQMKSSISNHYAMKDAVFNISATISRIYHEYGFYYDSCNYCKKKVLTRDNKFYCNTGKKTVNHITPRYKLQFDIQDEDDYIQVILFDSQVQMLLENTVAMMKDMFEKEKEDEQFQQLNDREDDRLITFTKSVRKQLFQKNIKAPVSKTPQNDEANEYEPDHEEIIKNQEGDENVREEEDKENEKNER